MFAKYLKACTFAVGLAPSEAQLMPPITLSAILWMRLRMTCGALLPRCSKPM